MFRSLKSGLGMFALVGAFALLAATTDGAPTPKKAAKSKVKPLAASQLSIRDFFFDPKTKQISAGDSVSWTNNGGQTHTVTADDGSFDYTVQPGDTSPSVSPQQTVTYHCTIHPGMTGTITVGNGPQAKTAAKKPARKPAKKPARKVPAKQPKTKG